MHMKTPAHMLSDSWSLFTKHWHALLLVTVIPLIFGAFVEGAVWAIKMVSDVVYGYNTSLVLAVVLALISVVAIAGVYVVNIIVSLAYRIALPRVVANTAKKSTSKEHVFTTYRAAIALIWPFIAISVLSGIILFSATILFIIPALIAGVYLAFTVFSFVVHNKRGVDALAHSIFLVRGKFWRVAGRLLVPVIALLAALAVPLNTLLLGLSLDTMLGSWLAFLGFVLLIGVGVLAAPVIASYKYLLYMALLAEAPDYDAAESKKNRRTVKRVLIASVIVSVLALMTLVVGAAVLGGKVYRYLNSGGAPYSEQWRELKSDKGFSKYSHHMQVASTDKRFQADGVSLVIPQDWRILSTTDDDGTRTVLVKDKEGAREYPSTLVVSSRAAEAGEETGYGVLLATQSDADANAGVLGTITTRTISDMMLDGDTAGVFAYELAVGPEDAPLGLASKTIITVQNGRVYTITALSSVAEFADAEIVLTNALAGAQFMPMPQE